MNFVHYKVIFTSLKTNCLLKCYSKQVISKIFVQKNLSEQIQGSLGHHVNFRQTGDMIGFNHIVKFHKHQMKNEGYRG